MQLLSPIRVSLVINIEIHNRFIYKEKKNKGRSDLMRTNLYHIHSPQSSGITTEEGAEWLYVPQVCSEVSSAGHGKATA